jgi:hypothetical protein
MGVNLHIQIPTFEPGFSNKLGTSLCLRSTLMVYDINPPQIRRPCTDFEKVPFHSTPQTWIP